MTRGGLADDVVVHAFPACALPLLHFLQNAPGVLHHQDRGPGGGKDERQGQDELPAHDDPLQSHFFNGWKHAPKSP